jgi:hypothetical protein
MRSNLKEEISRLKSLMLFEVSDKVIKQLTAKYKKTDPRLTDAEIVQYIDDFERFKASLPVDGRDIARYSFPELKSLIDNLRTKKLFTDAFDYFKKTEKSIERVRLKRAIKNFYEIQSALPKKYQDIKTFKFDVLKDLLYGEANEQRPNYKTLLTKKLKEKFEKEGVDKDQVEFYLSKYFRGMHVIPPDAPPVDRMSFEDFEHFIDGAIPDENVVSSGEINTTAELLVDTDELQIYHAGSKKDAVPFGFLASWCISRQGGGNLFYNYRLSKRLTIYFVINKTIPRTNVNYGLVILVERDGRYNLADMTNSGTFAGSTIVPWSTIVEKNPLLDPYKKLFKPEPLTDEEANFVSKYMSTNPGPNPTDYFDGDIDKINTWLELRSSSIENEQYANLPEESQKTYISLGYSLNSVMIQTSPPSVLAYYVNKKLESMKNIPLDRLSTEDIALLTSNDPNARKLRINLKSKFSSDLSSTFKDDAAEINYPNSIASKYAALYGLDEIFELIPENVSEIQLENTSTSEVSVEIPESIIRFKQVRDIYIVNFISELPEEIGNLPSLMMLSLQNNTKLKSLPRSLVTSKTLEVIVLRNYTGELPSGFLDVYELIESGSEDGTKLYIRTGLDD